MLIYCKRGIILKEYFYLTNLPTQIRRKVVKHFTRYVKKIVRQILKLNDTLSLVRLPGYFSRLMNRKNLTNTEN